ncbi:macrolide family glycosyltransferase [Streptomyces rugosispiralis]|uniref:OleI family self-immunity macrolide glycosyltransferase n=1 Tax=Streptomyces rugosispiralis TaxID=2967341 RepID=A0ABT1V7G5_9ACTN|nr:macrolide family glycosyltransferase [Streptomyces rugosispiralis]MCQ8193315.1 OleI family self-immunity macrolide glycosyltransferase [Streptomyces rugosispiralis]
MSVSRPGRPGGIPENARPLHIAMFNIPADGHVNPNLALCAELVERGHRVSFSIDEGHAEAVRAAGAEPVLYRTTFPDAGRGERFPITDVIAMSSLFLREAVAVLPQQLAAFEDDRPDLVLYDYAALSAQILAKRWGVPAVRLSPTRVSSNTYERDLAPFYASVADDPAWLAYRKEFQHFLDEGGMDLTIEEFLYVGRADHYVVTIPRAFQADADELGDAYTFVGPVVRDQGLQAPWKPPADGRPVLLIAFGSIAPEVPEVQRIFFECAEAFADGPWHVVMSIGRHLDPADFGPPPPHMELIPEAPQLRVLAEAAVFITHAGMGSTMEAIQYGVPMVAVPMGFDQMENARLIDELGIGVRTPFEGVTGEELREAVERVSADPGVARRLAELRAEILAEGGAPAAADAIEGAARRARA